MAAELEAKYKEHTKDVSNLFILILIAFVLGVYLIVSTVLISKDGVFYIERAQRFANDPMHIIKTHPPGYPILIFVAHKFVTLFAVNSSLFTWIYSAQSITLLFRLLGLIPLYFIGKWLVGSTKSFYAMLILILLPHPAKMTCDVTREWPHILLLATGFLFLLWGGRQGKWWTFGLAGLSSGLGYWIRPECTQLVIYGALWIMIKLFLPKKDMSRPKSLCTLFILLIGYAIPAVPYMAITGEILPTQLEILVSSSHLWESEKIQEQRSDSGNNICTASNVPGKIVKAIGRLAGEISDDLMYYFVPALLIGIYSHFRRKSAAKGVEKFFITAFVLLNVIMMILLYYNWKYISGRHCLPMVVFLIFYVPVGLETLAGWLGSKFSESQLEAVRHPQLWFFVLLVTGVGICLPKLFRPIRVEKQGYREVSKWLMENTAPMDIVAVPDKRISFYAERRGFIYSTKVPKEAEYVVKILKNESEELNFDRAAQEKYSVWVDKRKNSKKKLVIYRMM